MKGSLRDLVLFSAERTQRTQGTSDRRKGDDKSELDKTVVMAWVGSPLPPPPLLKSLGTRLQIIKILF